MLDNTQIQKIKKTSFGSLPAQQSFINLIYEDINDIKHKFIDIGFRLDEAQRLHYPEELGYNNIHELAEHLFGFKKSTTYSLINDYQRFGYKMKLLPEYEKFSQSQLTEMCSLPEYMLKHITNDMTIQDIRDYKKAYNELTVWNEETVKNTKKLIEDYRNSKKENSRCLENKNKGNMEIKNYETKKYGSYSPFPTPNYIIQWRHGGEIHNYAYMLFTDVTKVLETFNENTDYRVYQIDVNHIKELVCTKNKKG